MGTWADEARKQFDAVADDPHARYRFAEAFFTRHPGEGIHDYGCSELAFIDWEVRRRCLGPLDAPAPGSPWWRSVNATILCDAAEAHLMFDAGAPTTEASGGGAVGWLDFLRNPSHAAWYAAHNRSVVNGYLAAADLAALEDGHEIKLMNLVLSRVLFTQAVLEEQPWTFGRFRRWFPPLVAPTNRFVRRVVHDPDLYPGSYPLDPDDRRRLERRVTGLGAIPVAVIDLALIRPRLPELYDWAASRLDVPRLRTLLLDRMPCYPWGARLSENELRAIELNDAVSMPIRAISAGLRWICA